MIEKAMLEGEGLFTPPALFALMNLPDVLGKIILGEAFPAVLALDLDRLRFTRSPGRFG